MLQENDLKKFIDAQATNYLTALSEIKKGKKTSHWMWYIFPQVQGLGISETAKFYAIKDLTEAEAFLKHPILGDRLIAISKALIALDSNNANYIFGSPDDIKLKSCMTLFAASRNADPVFQLVLDKFFNGTKDINTLRIINKL